MSVRFQYADAAILFCVPEAGCDLNFLVQRYTFFERIAVPDYQVVSGCLSRAVRAGAVPVPTAGQYSLTPEWYVYIHQRDGEITPSELAMIEFADELEAHEWPIIGPEFVLPTDEFERAAEHTRRYLDALLSPYIKLS